MEDTADNESRKRDGVERTYTKFLIAGESFAVDVDSVKEIIKSEELTSLDEPSLNLEGFIEQHSVRIPVLNTKKILSLDSDVREGGIIIVNIDGSIFGLMVDIGVDIEIFTSIANPKPTKGSEAYKRFVEGTITVSDKVVNVLALSSLISKESRQRFFAGG